MWGYDPRNMMMKLLTFHAVPRIENVHPLEGGLFRRKYRRDRRPGMPLESPLRVLRSLTPGKSLSKHFRFAPNVLATLAHPSPRRARPERVYADIAMTPVQDSEFEEMQMYTATQAAKFAVAKLRRHKAPSARIS